MADDAAWDSSKAGLIIAAHGRRGLLATPEATALPYLVGNRRLKAVCGDRVDFELIGPGEPALVTAIRPRRNELKRQPATGQAAEIIAANVDRLLLVLAPEPEPELFVADRYLCAAELMGAEAAIAWNKADLGAGPPPALAVYADLGYPLLPISCLTGGGVPPVAEWLGQGTAVLVGQSGVGKSSLLNRLAPAAAAAIGSVSTSTREGRHTTTASVLHRLTGGGRLIDTPGVRDFVPAVPDRRSIGTGFREIARESAGCRFLDCSHLREPGCAVQAALEQGRLDPRRLESYRRLMNLANQAAARSY